MSHSRTSPRYWSKDTVKASFLRHEGYLGAVGAFLLGTEAEGGAFVDLLCIFFYSLCHIFFSRLIFRIFFLVFLCQNRLRLLLLGIMGAQLRLSPLNPSILFFLNRFHYISLHCRQFWLLGFFLAILFRFFFTYFFYRKKYNYFSPHN